MSHDVLHVHHVLHVTHCGICHTMSNTTICLLILVRCRTWSSSSNLPSTCCSASLSDDANVENVTVLADCLVPRKQAPLCRSARSMLAHNATVELHATDNHLTGGESCTNDSRSEPMIDSSCSLGHRHVENVILDENICGVDVKATDVKATDALVNDRLDDGGSDNSPPVALSKSRERVLAAASVSPPPEHVSLYRQFISHCV